MTVEVIDVAPLAIEVVDVTPDAVELLEVIVGPAGPRGPAGADARVYRFTDLATWSVSHTLGRPPVVSLYDADGHPFACGALVANDNAVIASFPAARSGSMVLV